MASSHIWSSPRSYNLSFIPEEGIIKADLAAIAATGTALNDLHAQKAKAREALETETRGRLKAIRADKNLDDKAKEEAQEKIVNEFYGKTQAPR